VTEAELVDPELQRQRQRLERAKMWLAALAALFSLAALGVSVTVAIGNRANGEVIRDCVTPTGGCYRRQSERTEETLSRLADLMLAVELCGQRYFNDKDARACVQRSLKGH
jgi:hypothetical protein